jgi:hypothetical protein
MAFTENFSQFFDTTAGFADSATITGFGSVDGIFTDEYLEELAAEGSTPMFLCKESDVTGIGQDVQVVVQSRTFVTKEVMPDGTGLMLLRMEEQ